MLSNANGERLSMPVPPLHDSQEQILADKRNKRRHFASPRKSAEKDHEDGDAGRASSSRPISWLVTNEKQGEQSDLDQTKDGSSSPEPMSEASLYSPSVVTPSRTIHPAGAACEDCRRKHKRCCHRSEPKDKSNDRRRKDDDCSRLDSDQLQRKRRQSLSVTNANDMNIAMPTLASSMGMDKSRRGRAVEHVSRELTSGQKSRNEKRPRSEAGDLPGPQKPINLTANGKRRGRPPKNLVKGRLAARATANQSPRTDRGDTKSPVAVEVDEPCRSSKKIILGDRRISPLNSMNDSVTRPVLQERCTNAGQHVVNHSQATGDPMVIAKTVRNTGSPFSESKEDRRGSIGQDTDEFPENGDFEERQMHVRNFRQLKRAPRRVPCSSPISSLPSSPPSSPVSNEGSAESYEPHKYENVTSIVTKPALPSEEESIPHVYSHLPKMYRELLQNLIHSEPHFQRPFTAVREEPIH